MPGTTCSTFEYKRRILGLVCKLLLQTGQIKVPIYCHTNENDSEIAFYYARYRCFVIIVVFSFRKRAPEQKSNESCQSE